MNKSQLIIQKIGCLYEAKKLSNKERLQFYVDFIKKRIGLDVKVHPVFNKISKRAGRTFFMILGKDDLFSPDSVLAKLKGGFSDDNIIKNVESGGGDALAIFVTPIKDREELDKLRARFRL